eukprot:GILJ01019295.1.p1 GENE.GILJ01019295.1~~GILJ01019295.1.p1  ORF type:complete len:463 (+),score=80.14 GILJ01019295.1:540-1928(+)
MTNNAGAIKLATSPLLLEQKRNFMSLTSISRSQTAELPNCPTPTQQTILLSIKSKMEKLGNLEQIQKQSPQQGKPVSLAMAFMSLPKDVRLLLSSETTETANEALQKALVKLVISDSAQGRLTAPYLVVENKKGMTLSADQKSHSINGPCREVASTFGEANNITLKVTHFVLTVGMATPEAMAAGVAEAFAQTRFIKIKLDGDEALTYSRLLAIGAVLAKQEDRKPKVHIVIDANASWTPASTSTFAANIVRMRLGQPPELLIGSKGFEQGTPVDLPLDMTAESCKSIFEALGYAIDMIEQPYRPDFVTNVALADALPEWAAALAHCNDRGIKLFADESVCSAEDLPSLLPYVNGINIKLEKCGGLLAAFEFVEAAQRIPSISFTWIGIMVGSRLLCNTAGQLLVRTGQGDVDGALLLTEGSQLFSGGFDWIAATTDMDEAHGTISLREGSCGSGCELKVVQ